MSGQLILSYPWYLCAICILLGIGVASILYYRDPLVSNKPFLKAGLFTFRTLLISTIAFLILGPLWRGFNTRTEKPMIIYLEDQSSSIKDFTDSAQLEAFDSKREALFETLSADFEMERYAFGSDLVEWGEAMKGKDKATDISGALNKLLEMHSYQNIGAVLMATDGIYNQGYNPSYSNLAAGTSVYTIGLGDSTISKDLFVQALQYPRVVYLGDQFQLDIEWGAQHLKDVNFNIDVKDEYGKSWLQKGMTIRQEEQYGKESVVIDANQPGIRKIAVRLNASAQEDISSNNVQYAYVEVLDGRKKVLMLYDSPHPDIKAIRTVIDQNRNYEVEAVSVKKFNGNLDGYDLVLMHGWPFLNNRTIAKRIWQNCIDDGRSVVAILTATSDIDEFNALQSVVDVASSGGQMNDVQAISNNDFYDFQWPEKLSDALRYYPPLLAPFAEYSAGGNTKTILYQRLGDINTGYPLVISGREGKSNVLFIMGEGLWRWRMSEYAKENSSATFDQFLNQVIQYVAVKEDKRKFRLFVQKNLSWENEPVQLNAELYNANFELINDPEVNVRITKQGGDEFEFAMDKTLNAYQLDAGLLPIGSYTATASTEWGGESYTAAVRFTVREVQLEALKKQADHGMLYNLSEATGGKFYDIQTMLSFEDDMKEDVNLKPVLYQSEKTTSLLQFQWIFFLLLAFLSIEWITRKWLGGY